MKRNKVLILFISFLIIIGTIFLLVNFQNSTPSLDRIASAEIYNIATNKNLTINEEESKKLYNSFKVNTREKNIVKARFNNEITFYDNKGNKLIRIDAVDPQIFLQSKSISPQAIIASKLIPMLYEVDSNFYYTLNQIGEKHNFNLTPYDFKR